MANPISDLKALLQPKLTADGTVIAATPDTVTLATDQGVTVIPASGITYTAGDSVQLASGAVQARLMPTSGIPYTV